MRDARVHCIIKVDNSVVSVSVVLSAFLFQVLAHSALIPKVLKVMGHGIDLMLAHFVQHLFVVDGDDGQHCTWPEKLPIKSQLL